MTLGWARPTKNSVGLALSTKNLRRVGTATNPMTVVTWISGPNVLRDDSFVT